MIELTPELDVGKQQPLYMQLYVYIRTQIVQGNIEKGNKLPSIRQLSKHLGISRNTVETAYAQLIAEGYVESKPRIGVIVKELDEEIFPSLKLSQLNKSITVQKTEKIKYDFRYGNIDTAHFPLKIWRKCINEALDRERDGMFWYGERQGDVELRQQIAHYLFQSRGIHCSYEQIVIGSGIHQITGLLCQLFKGQAPKIAMENPCYDGIRSVFVNHNFQIIPIPLEDDGINIKELTSCNARLAYVTPSHQLPLGMVLPIGKRQKLLRWAVHSSAYIIEDDYDSEFRYESKPIPALKALDTHDRVIYLGTFSKVLTPSIRVSYLVLPRPLLTAFQKTFHNYNQPVATLIQQALAEFMKQGHLERHIRKMRTIYARKQKTLIRTLHECFGERVDIIGEKAGLHLLIQIKGFSHVRELVEKAESAGIKVYSAAKYWHGDTSTPPTFILLGFGGMEETGIIDGIRELKMVWNIC